MELSVPLSSDNKLIGEPEVVYSPEYFYEEYMARPNKVTVMEDERGKWERIDRIKGQGIINGIAVLAILTITGFILFYSKDDIKNIFPGPNKENKNSSDISDKTLLSTESNHTNFNKLKELSLMKEDGFITEEEFEAKKRDIIDKM